MPKKNNINLEISDTKSNEIKNINLEKGTISKLELRQKMLPADIVSTKDVDLVEPSIDENHEKMAISIPLKTLTTEKHSLTGAKNNINPELMEEAKTILRRQRELGHLWGLAPGNLSVLHTQGNAKMGIEIGCQTSNNNIVKNLEILEINNVLTTTQKKKFGFLEDYNDDYYYRNRNKRCQFPEVIYNSPYRTMINKSNVNKSEEDKKNFPKKIKCCFFFNMMEEYGADFIQNKDNIPSGYEKKKKFTGVIDIVIVLEFKKKKSLLKILKKFGQFIIHLLLIYFVD